MLVGLGAGLWPDIIVALPVMAAGCALGFAAAQRASTSGALVMLLLLGAAARTPAIGNDPETSTDLWRYLWEGRVCTAGENPARIPPSSPRLAALRDERIWPRVEHGDIPTIYPTVAQAGFTVAHWLGGTPVAWKSLLLLLEVVAAAALGRRCLRAGRNLGPVVLWLWNPLLVGESSGAGHLDSLGASLLLLGILAFEGQRHARAIAALLASALVKPLAAPLFLITMRRHLFATAVAGFCGIALLYPLTTPPPSPPLAGAERSDLWFRVDDRATISASEQTMLDGTAWPEPTPAISAPDLIGRYALRIETAGNTVSPVVLDFDASQWVTRIDHMGLWGPRFGYSIDDGECVVRDRLGSNEPLLRLQLSADRMAVTGTSLSNTESLFGVAETANEPVYGFKIAESPLMAYHQYGTRWSNDAGFVHHALRTALNSRTGVNVLAALGVLAIITIAMKRRWAWPDISLALAAWTVALLPVLYPWYLIWLLPGACTGARGGRVVAALCGAAPLIHLLL